MREGRKEGGREDEMNERTYMYMNNQVHRALKRKKERGRKKNN